MKCELSRIVDCLHVMNARKRGREGKREEKDVPESSHLLVVKPIFYILLLYEKMVCNEGGQANLFSWENNGF